VYSGYLSMYRRLLRTSRKPRLDHSVAVLLLLISFGWVSMLHFGLFLSASRSLLTVIGCLDIRYDAPRGTIDGRYDKVCTGTAVANFRGGTGIAPSITDNRRGLVILCPKAFNLRDSAGDLPRPDEPSKCKMFKNAPYASVAMDTLSATLLHEFLQSNYTNGTLNEPLVEYLVGTLDYWAADDKVNPKRIPKNGYGPWNTMRLQQTKHGLSMFNNDNYIWFAL
jgi:hypothetical protein